MSAQVERSDFAKEVKLELSVRQRMVVVAEFFPAHYFVTTVLARRVANLPSRHKSALKHQCFATNYYKRTQWIFMPLRPMYD